MKQSTNYKCSFERLYKYSNFNSNNSFPLTYKDSFLEYNLFNDSIRRNDNDLSYSMKYFRLICLGLQLLHTYIDIEFDVMYFDVKFNNHLNDNSIKINFHAIRRSVIRPKIDSFPRPKKYVE